jgi:hypothetical protein
MRNASKKFGELLPDAYANEGVTVAIDFDPTGKFGRYMDRRLKRLVKRQRRLWPASHLGAAERADLDMPSCQDTHTRD